MVLDHNKERCAIKVLNPSRLKTSEAFVTAAEDLAMEAKILSELDHENTIRLQGICSGTFSSLYAEGNDWGYFLVFELMNDILSNSLVRWRKSNWQSSAIGKKWVFGKKA
jgi:serine/threonine protein kinase